MASMTRLSRRLHRWHRYADRTYWNPRVSRPWWMGPDPAIADGHRRAWDAREHERQRRADRAQRLRMVPADADDVRCTLGAAVWPSPSSCYCTGRPGCQLADEGGTGADDTWDDDEDADWDEEGWGDLQPRPVETIDAGGLL